MLNDFSEVEDQSEDSRFTSEPSETSIYDGMVYQRLENPKMHYSVDYPTFMKDIRALKAGAHVVFLSGEKEGDPLISIRVLDSPPLPNIPGRFREQTPFKNVTDEDIGNDYLRVDGDCKGEYGDANYINYFLFRGRHIYQFLMFYPKGEKSKFNKILMHVLSSFDDNFAAEDTAVLHQPTKETFASKINRARWVNTNMGFKVPDFMCPPAETYIDELPSTLTTYNYQNIELSYCLLGNWATMEDYPNLGDMISANTRIKSITYRHGSILSGYTDDGRIYYLNTTIYSGGEVNHLGLLALVYPKAYQKSVGKLIKEVQHWK